MRVIGIHSGLDPEGLTAALIRAALEGAREAGAEVREISLDEAKIRDCLDCERGAGPCWTQGRCIQDDGMETVRDELRSADALVICTTAVEGTLPESARNFFHRWRRLEAKGESRAVYQGKPVAGGVSAPAWDEGAVGVLMALKKHLDYFGLHVVDLAIATGETAEPKCSMRREMGRLLARLAGKKLDARTAGKAGKTGKARR